MARWWFLSSLSLYLYLSLSIYLSIYLSLSLPLMSSYQTLIHHTQEANVLCFLTCIIDKNKQTSVSLCNLFIIMREAASQLSERLALFGAQEKKQIIRICTSFCHHSNFSTEIKTAKIKCIQIKKKCSEER